VFSVFIIGCSFLLVDVSVYWILWLVMLCVIMFVCSSCCRCCDNSDGDMCGSLCCRLLK